KRVSKATVYNTLALFVEHGLLREVIVDPSKIVYDSNLSAHHHFYNIDTGLLQDIPSEQVTVANLSTLPEGTAAAGIEVIIRVRNNA
ncbi:MAG TPA: transcriptional repressor, partial [Gammaproteobacteria bacterium]|nr:transcriptional repressor [Gammaproteobacteria bacterium]